MKVLSARVPFRAPRKLPVPTFRLAVRVERLEARCSFRRQQGRVHWLTVGTITLGGRVLGRRTIPGRASPEHVLRDFRKNPLEYGYPHSTREGEMTECQTVFEATLDGQGVASGSLRGEHSEQSVRAEIRSPSPRTTVGPAYELATLLRLI